MIRIKLPELCNDAIYFILFAINDNPKTGLLDHYTLRDLIGA
jgi:hypothetical protein